MDRIDDKDRRGLVCFLVHKMVEEESWAGETQIQKSVVFLQEMLNVPLGYDFVIYKHGPFSFGLRRELALMRTRFQLDLEPHLRYGPSFLLGHRGVLALQTPTGYTNAIDFVAKEISTYDTRSLERLSTAFFIQERNKFLNDFEVASEITRIKPHITPAQAKDAVERVNALRRQAEEEGVIRPDSPESID